MGRMRRRLSAVLLLLAALALPGAAKVDKAPKLKPIAPPAKGAADAGKGLASQIDAVIASEPEKWGIVITRAADGTPVYAHNADALLLPASNMKACTTAAV